MKKQAIAQKLSITTALLVLFNLCLVGFTYSHVPKNFTKDKQIKVSLVSELELDEELCEEESGEDREQLYILDSGFVCFCHFVFAQNSSADFSPNFKSYHSTSVPRWLMVRHILL